MQSKRLSQRALFKEALVIQAEYSSAPGVSGHCELGVLWRKSKTEVWSWIDEGEAEKILEVGPDAGCRLLVEVMADEPAVSTAAINPLKVAVINDRPPLGQILAMDGATIKTSRRSRRCWARSIGMSS
jgi:hypothetical protein